MLSEDIEKLIEAKRLEIEQEKAVLGLSQEKNHNVEDKENLKRVEKRVGFHRPRALSENNATDPQESEEKNQEIPADLERYIRRYLGLPVMLKAGEYSPNNPLLRGERGSGDALLGLGEYERRRNTLRKIRQRQYKEYLDQQAKIKQEEKEKQEREKREREERERLEEERERQRERELARDSPERRRASFSNSRVCGANNAYINRVDTGVQVDRHTPLSVAVQTDDNDMFNYPPKWSINEAERELSPRCARAACAPHARRRSYGDFYERTYSVAKDDKYRSLQETYKPSILDADTVSLRNLQAEKEAAARRQFYQQELKNQILEQQRIREERINREKMLEQAEMRRLEQQLRSLKMAQEKEIERNRDITTSMKYNADEYDMKKSSLQQDIDVEKQSLKYLHRKPKTDSDYIEKPYTMTVPESSVYSHNYDLENYLRKNLNPSKDSFNLPYKSVWHEYGQEERRTSQNNYDYGYERRQDKNSYEKHARQELEQPHSYNYRDIGSRHVRQEENIYNRQEIQRHGEQIYDQEASLYETQRNVRQVDGQNFNQGANLYNRSENEQRQINRQENVRQEKFDTLPIPVLRHSPKHKVNETEKYEINEDLSEEMKLVDDKWKVPAVQKNILKNLKSEGRNVNILTQLGSIRRQLQLEQMKLDKIKNTDV